MKRIVSAVLLIVLLFSLASCSDKKVPEETSELATKADTTVIEETTEETTVEETTEAPYDWKADAITVLSQYIETDATYSVYDMNDDNIPEIIVMNGTIAADTKFYLYDLKKNTAEPIEFGSGNSMLCGYDGNIILQYCKMGFETITEYKYDGNEFSEDILLDREVPLDEDYLGLKSLDSYSVNDLSGFSWMENPSDGNAEIVASAK